MKKCNQTQGKRPIVLLLRKKDCAINSAGKRESSIVGRMVRSLCLKAQDKLFLIDVVKEKLHCLMLLALCENFSAAASCTGN